MPESLTALILAAGKSTRMQGLFPDIPKVLLPIDGKPMIVHLLEAIEAVDTVDEIVVVTGPDADRPIRKALVSHRLSYALQREPLGTGQAVLSARTQIPKTVKHLMVLCGDHPLFSAKTLSSVAQRHVAGGQPVTMLTVDLPDYDGWRSTFAHCGRIIRASNGSFERIVEAKDATTEELDVTEVNPSLYCFQTDWLWERLLQVTPNNAPAQYYITDVVGMAVAEGRMVETVRAKDHREAAAVNTPKEFGIVRQKYVELNPGRKCPTETAEKVPDSDLRGAASRRRDSSRAEKV